VADRGRRRRRFDDGLGRGREDRGVQVGVAMDERAVDPCWVATAETLISVPSTCMSANAW
jgi:hypothetical protein